MRLLAAAVALAVSLAPSAGEARRHRERREREPRLRLYHEGDVVPDGYHVETRPRSGLAWLGAGLFGVPYTLTAIVGLAGRDPDNRWLLVPVFGPIIYVANSDTSGDFAAQGVAFLALDSIAQATGLTLLAVGVNTKMTVLARNDVAVVPSCTATGCALQAVGRF